MVTPQFNIRATSFQPPNPSNQHVKCVSSKPEVRQVNTKIPSVSHTRQFNTKQRAFLSKRRMCVELTFFVESMDFCRTDEYVSLTASLC